MCTLTQFGEAKTFTYRLGVVVKANRGRCRGLLATLPIPANWPEQIVTVVSEEKSRYVRRVAYKSLGGGARQMRVTIPDLPAGAEARATITLKLRRHALLAPREPGAFVLTKRIPSRLRSYLLPSPFIESTNAKIKALAKELVAGKQGAWEQVEAIYDGTRAKVKYENGPLKGALQALKDGSGDCEELTSLFIALCRANKIPARTVWVPGHCYPEFYLSDKDGKGHWIPCQAAGTRVFGSMAEDRPILQKGDNFRVPEKSRERQRYVAEFLTGKSGQPSVRFIRERVDDKSTTSDR